MLRSVSRHWILCSLLSTQRHRRSVALDRHQSTQPATRTRSHAARQTAHWCNAIGAPTNARLRIASSHLRRSSARGQPRPAVASDSARPPRRPRTAGTRKAEPFLQSSCRTSHAAMDLDRPTETQHPLTADASDRSSAEPRQPEPAAETTTDSAEASSRGRSGRTATTAGGSTLIDSLWSGGSGITTFNRDSFRQPLPSSSSLLAFRSRFKHRGPKSTSSTTTLSSQPVLVRAYTGSRPPSRARSIQSITAAPTMGADSKLPPIEAFSFDGILRAVEPDIQDAIDAIAEICARSRMSLANEHAAHMPPQGEILAGGPYAPTSRFRQHGLAIRTSGLEHPLTAVPEASSSSERLAGGSKASSRSGTGKMTAYGSLKNIITRTLSQDQSSNASWRRIPQRKAGSWAILDSPSSHAAIVLIGHTEPSKQLSLEPPTHETTLSNTPADPHFGQLGSRQVSTPHADQRSSVASTWVAWRRLKQPTAAIASIEQPPTAAESSLKDLLR